MTGGGGGGGEGGSKSDQICMTSFLNAPHAYIHCDEFVLNVILYLYTVLIELIFVYSCYRVIEILWLEIMLSKTNLTFGFTFIYYVELLESSLQFTQHN